MRRIIIMLWFGALAALGIESLPNKHVEPATTTLTFTVPVQRQQTDSTAPRFVVLDDYIREYLGEEWDKHAGDTIKLERGYCVRWQYDIWAREKAYRVTQIFPAEVLEAQPSEIVFSCPPGKNGAEIHVHPPQTCINGDCWNGGPYAWQCLPSDADRNYLLWAMQPFGLVQCDRNAIRFYFPMGDNR
jgi:uncharacterized Fe-S cluster protein YjdI